MELTVTGFMKPLMRHQKTSDLELFRLPSEGS